MSDDADDDNKEEAPKSAAAPKAETKSGAAASSPRKSLFLNLTPGPGTYTFKSEFKAVDRSAKKKGGKGDKKGGGDPAARRDKYRTIHDDPVPGPGAYVNSAPSSFRGGGKAAESTKPKGKGGKGGESRKPYSFGNSLKHRLEKPDEVPGPGSHYVETKWVSGGGKAAEKGKKPSGKGAKGDKPRPHFGTRVFVPSHDDGPGPGAYPNAAKGDFPAFKAASAPPKAKPKGKGGEPKKGTFGGAIVRRQPDSAFHTVPGPGAYFSNKPAQEAKKTPAAKSGKKGPLQRMYSPRFPSSRHPPGPGPGAYGKSTSSPSKDAPKKGGKGKAGTHPKFGLRLPQYDTTFLNSSNAGILHLKSLESEQQGGPVTLA